jgi:hypothetical protein
MNKIGLICYCWFVSGLAGFARMDKTGRAVKSMRENITKNLTKDIQDALKKGKTKPQLLEYYWSTRLFRIVWLSLDLDKNDFGKLVEKV